MNEKQYDQKVDNKIWKTSYFHTELMKNARSVENIIKSDLNSFRSSNDQNKLNRQQSGQNNEFLLIEGEMAQINKEKQQKKQIKKYGTIFIPKIK